MFNKHSSDGGCWLVMDQTKAALHRLLQPVDFPLDDGEELCHWIWQSSDKEDLGEADAERVSQQLQLQVSPWCYRQTE